MNVRVIEAAARPEAAAGSRSIDAFLWPAPPNAEFVRAADRLDWGDCALALKDGTSVLGTLYDFRPNEGLLTFRQCGDDDDACVAFSLIISLHLRRPVELQRETLGPTHGESVAPPGSYPFCIELANGEVFEGETRGYVKALCGLFLYLPADEGRVSRCFIPTHAASDCHIDAPIGQRLIDRRAVEPQAVAAALDIQAMMRTRLGRRPLASPFEDALQQLGLAGRIGPGHAAQAGDADMPLGEILTKMGCVDEKTIRGALAEAPPDVAARTAPARGRGPDPADAGQRLRVVRPQPAAPAAGKPIAVHELVSRLAAEGGDLDITERQAVKSDSALVRLVNRIIADAVQQRASDIHIEANLGPKTTRVRLRKDGVLVNYLELPSQFRNAVISRIKIMSQLDITERRKPQDGKIDFGRFGPEQVELRVATVPTASGLEDVVMRVLAEGTPVPVDELGLDGDVLDRVKNLIARPHGLFLVCGPTGSGKTTTLHSLLAFLNTAERKIWTAEDPIEITQPGLRQVQVNAKIGWTFANAMRSFMRADPDVIMVGEMRDAETAKIGIEASLTGHLVLSTLHTNSGPESIVRLLDLGMDPFNFADALLGVLAQRLTKRLCPACKLPYVPARAELEELLLQYCGDTAIAADRQRQAWLERYGGRGRRITLFRACGCSYCDGSGYQGRIGVHELLVADPAIKRLVQSRAPVAEVKAAAMTAGMRTLRQDGIEKVLQGLTDIRQVGAVCA